MIVERTYNRASAIDPVNRLEPLTVRRGMICKVLKGYKETQSDLWLQKGDIVRVEKVYPRVALVRKVKATPITGFRLRECFRLADISQYLKPI